MSRVSAREKVHQILSDEKARWFFPVNNVIALFIVASVIVVILETVPELYAKYAELFLIAEYGILTLFGIEYALRVWSAPDRIRYMTSFFGLIDLISILPGVLLIFMPGVITYHALGVLRILRVLRLLRTFRLVKLVIPKRQRESIAREFHDSSALINLEIYLFALTCVVILSGTFMYVVESAVPGSHFQSIPDGLWWAIVTISTVGYGDTVPITAVGKAIATVTMLAGLALFVLMLTVVGRAMQLALFGTSIDNKK